jgi:ATP-dependent Clp protease protease subunit
MAAADIASAEIPTSGFGFDIYQQLLKQRIVFLGQQVDDTIANSLAAQILYLAGQDNDQDIWLYINSPGGSVTAGMALYDTMQFVKPDIATVCLGLGASMGQFLLTAGASGKRFALPHSRILMHQPSAGVQGQAVDIAIQAENLIKIKREMAGLIAEHAGQDVERIIEDSDRDRWFSANEAKEYGLLDHVISRAGELTQGSQDD